MACARYRAASRSRATARQPMSRRQKPSGKSMASTAAYAFCCASSTSLPVAVTPSTRPPEETTCEARRQMGACWLFNLQGAGARRVVRGGTPLPSYPAAGHPAVRPDSFPRAGHGIHECMLLRLCKERRCGGRNQRSATRHSVRPGALPARPSWPCPRGRPWRRSRPPARGWAPPWRRSPGSPWPPAPPSGWGRRSTRA